jgi:hypothetical protein
MRPKKLRVPAVVVVVTVATTLAAAACGHTVCKQGDSNCNNGGAGGTGSSTFEAAG